MILGLGCILYHLEPLYFHYTLVFNYLSTKNECILL